ncbi:hypothetical protein CDAR_73671 [Caerostris darwini]|uniref:Uncharacterized protein n=1 Tax=Caerostris darwini TaxID=1538125 RepID=A0AAV4MR17_9ARAC|nr:hypothetical protein CDAR_73671 [Caerostris darwini]
MVKVTFNPLRSPVVNPPPHIHLPLQHLHPRDAEEQTDGCREETIPTAHAHERGWGPTAAPLARWVPTAVKGGLSLGPVGRP